MSSVEKGTKLERPKGFPKLLLWPYCALQHVILLLLLVQNRVSLLKQMYSNGTHKHRRGDSEKWRDPTTGKKNRITLVEQVG